MACFANVIVSQGSVATYARCDEIFNVREVAEMGAKVGKGEGELDLDICPGGPEFLVRAYAIAITQDN